MSNLTKIFEQYKDSQFIFVQPGGNWGDHLIYFGAEHLASTLGLDFITLTKEQFLATEDFKDKIVYIHGGGGLNEWCSDSCFQCLEHAMTLGSKAFIYGPATCSQNMDFLISKLEKCFSEVNTSECYFFAREETTFQLFNKIECLTKHATVLKDQDTAFFLSKQAVIDRIGEEKFAYDFYGFREDNESCGTKVTFSFKEVVFDPAMRCTSFEHWLKVHLHAKKIVTNRTHSSIIGCILQKPTCLFAGSYHKNFSIWSETMQDKNINWLEPGVAFKYVTNGIWDTVLPEKVKASWKVRDFYLNQKGVPES